jgi:uncharacterized protein
VTGVRRSPLAVWVALAGLTVLVVATLAFALTRPATSYEDPFGDFAVRGAATRDTAGRNGRPMELFLRSVVGDIQGFWASEFRTAGLRYVPAPVMVFAAPVRTPCGPASAQTGPYYCELDHRVYLDINFFRVLARTFRAPGDFAEAYVVAHEIGHHVQALTGISGQVRRLTSAGVAPPNVLSIAQELQADCLAGVWAHSAYTRGLLERGDLQEALRAAAAVGDDRIQRRTIGRVIPELWTHGSADERRGWLRRGFTGGDPSACDTFSRVL